MRQELKLNWTRPKLDTTLIASLWQEPDASGNKCPSWVGLDPDKSQQSEYGHVSSKNQPAGEACFATASARRQEDAAFAELLCVHH